MVLPSLSSGPAKLHGNVAASYHVGARLIPAGASSAALLFQNTQKRPRTRQPGERGHGTGSLQGAVVTARQKAAVETSAELDQLIPIVYDELKRIARRQLRGRRDILYTTELVHEAYLKLSGHDSAVGRDRAHFYSIVVRAMRQVLVDHARKRAARKRGGDEPILVTSREPGLEMRLDQLIELDDALERLNAVNPRLRQLVELRFFGGLSESDIINLLGVSARTVERDWVKARLFLHRELYP